MGGASLRSPAMPPAPLSHSVHSDHSAHSSHAESLADAPVVSSHAKPPSSATTVMAALSPSDEPASYAATATATATTEAATAAAPVEKSKSSRKHGHSGKKTRKKSASELTPLILKPTKKSSSEEEIHPLPWFRSPEWPRRSPPQNNNTNDKRRKSRFRRGRTSYEQTSLCNEIMAKICCGVVDSEPDLELGLRTRRDGEQTDTEGFKQCVQFLVGLIVVVAAVLIIMIIFQPFQQSSGSLW